MLNLSFKIVFLFIFHLKEGLKRIHSYKDLIITSFLHSTLLPLTHKWVFDEIHHIFCQIKSIFACHNKHPKDLSKVVQHKVVFKQKIGQWGPNNKVAIMWITEQGSGFNAINFKLFWCVDYEEKMILNMRYSTCILKSNRDFVVVYLMLL